MKTSTQLSKALLKSIQAPLIQKPGDVVFSYPERILQFGTGVLLRGLCDYQVDKANREGRFKGRIVVVKSTAVGDASLFAKQDNLYTICVRGMNMGKVVSENIICSAISRVVSATTQWGEILKLAGDRQINIIISNTTEVGLQLVKESVFQSPPASYPARLLAFIYERYKTFSNESTGRLVVIPTELITNNGDKLKGIVQQLADFNELGDDFMQWMNRSVTYCNSLVDRIVTKDPGEKVLDAMQDELGYRDELLTMCEDYYLWAIEGDDEVKELLSFAGDNKGTFVSPDIETFRALKLHLLNGTHTLSASLAYLAGFDTVKQAMQDDIFRKFVEDLMLGEIATAMPFDIPGAAKNEFGRKVIDRFRNPFLEHQWLNITLQNTTKMQMRNVPVLLQFQAKNVVPEKMATGFAAYVLFMKAVKSDGNLYYGLRNGSNYRIADDHAAFFENIWKKESVDDTVEAVLQNTTFWGHDLSTFVSFKKAVSEKLTLMLTQGVRATIGISEK